MTEPDDSHNNTPTPEYRTGSFDVLVPSRLRIDDAQEFIKNQVHEELAKTREWPVKITANKGVRHSDGVMSWTASFETGPVGVEYF